MRRQNRNCLKGPFALALACATALVFTAAAVQARPATNAASHGTAAAASDCKLVVSGAPWRLRAGVPGGSVSGDKYTISARNVSCSSLRTWVQRFTSERNPGVGLNINGPRGYSCRSLTTPDSGAKLVVAGVCTHAPHNVQFFGWGPKVPGR